MEIVHLVGRVTEKYPSTDKHSCFICRDQQGLSRIVAAWGYCPLEPGDAFAAHGRPAANQSSVDFILTERPTFVLGNDEETLVRVFAEALRAPKRKASIPEGRKIYQLFASPDRSPKEIEDTIDRTMRHWCRGGNDFAEVISISQRGRLYRYWLQNRVDRSLYLYGLKKATLPGFETDEDEWEHFVILDACRRNPYTCYRIPIDLCPEIARQNHRVISPVERACGLIIRSMHELMIEHGWIAIPGPILVRRNPNLVQSLPGPEGRETSVLVQLNSVYEIVVDQRGDVPLFYLPFAYRDEQRLLAWLSSHQYQPIDLVDPVEANRNGVVLCVEQLEAVRSALSQPLTIITGGPGHGKTTVIETIVAACTNRSCYVTSFTGKAVARAREAAPGCKGYTLHQLLRKKDRPLIDLLIVDEASMVPLSLFVRFLRSYHPRNVVLIGDPNQLEPISWGPFFGPLIDHVPTVHLTRPFRLLSCPDGKNKDLDLNLQRIRNIASTDHTPDGRAFHFTFGPSFQYRRGGVGDVLELVRSLQRQGLGPDHCQIVTAFNQDVDVLNQACQEIYHPESTFKVSDGDRTWVLHDRVMLTKNHHDREIVNGDDGHVTGISSREIKVTFRGTGRPSYEFMLGRSSRRESPTGGEYEILTTSELKLAYALTVHKMQGSEARIIIFYVPVNPVNETFLTRRLVYTALSRAKDAVYIVGDLGVVERALLRTPQPWSDGIKAYWSRKK